MYPIHSRTLKAATGFAALPEQAQEDLITWFNVSKPDSDDLKSLAALFNAGRFHAWNCPKCGERCYFGDPEDWGEFQGVMEVDYTSYPGDETVYAVSFLRLLCDTCRCYPGNMHEPEHQPTDWESDDDE